MESRTRLILLVVVVFSVIIAGFLFTAYVDNEATVNIESESAERVIYTMETVGDLAPYKAHCTEIGGVLNECGSACATGSDLCVKGCALTCELVDATPVWEIYANENVGIQMPYRSDMTVYEDLEGQHGPLVSFSLWGPTQIENSEFFDGVGISIRRRELASGESPLSLAQEQEAQSRNVGEILSGIETITLAGRSGFGFMEQTVGAPVKRMFIKVDDDTVLDIGIALADPTDEGFASVTRKMFDALVIK